MNLSKSTWVLTIIIPLTILGVWLRLEGINQPVNGDLAGMLFMHFPTSWDSLLLNYRDTNQWTLFICLKLRLHLVGSLLGISSNNLFLL